MDYFGTVRGGTGRDGIGRGGTDRGGTDRGGTDRGGAQELTTRSRAALAALLGLVWPVACAGCGLPDRPLCPFCRAGFDPPATRWSLTAWATAPAAWATARYSGQVRHVVVRWKDRGRLDLTGVLADALAPAVGCLLDERDHRDRAGPVDPLAFRATAGGRAVGRAAAAGASSRGPAGDARVLLVPVPSSAAARRRRGEDVVRVLACAAARRLRAAGYPVRVAPVLRVTRRVADQSGLGAADRQANLRGAFGLRAVRRDTLSGRDCLVVDDVLTTGASAAEAARVMAEAGAVVLGAAASCATPHSGERATPPPCGLSGEGYLH